ncbi:MAG: Trm112 family protein [Candidatus Hermodarchaeota archaeon]
MKTWLFDILACPIDKFFPLKLYIFSFENEPNELQLIIDNYFNRDINLIKSEKIIEIYHEDNELLIRDNVVIKKTKLIDYLNLTHSSLIEFENIFGNSTNKLGNKCIEIMNTEIKSRVMEFTKNPKFDQIDSILPELYFFNKIKLDIEIQTGILFCNKCKRWYPIIDTIPQMLPDKYRDEKKEIDFLEKHKNLLDVKFFDQDLKPFKI